MSRPVIVSVQRGREREGFPHDGFRDASAANALRADTAGHGRAAFLHLNPLQVRAELPARNAGRLSAVTTEVLGFAALRDLVAKDCGLAANIAFAETSANLTETNAGHESGCDTSRPGAGDCERVSIVRPAGNASDIKRAAESGFGGPLGQSLTLRLVVERALQFVVPVSVVPIGRASVIAAARGRGVRPVRRRIPRGRRGIIGPR